MHIEPASSSINSPIRLSYKFQRLRERLRQAITSGELSGKLPGERELARRFNANPKTLSKALTDLAGEGLLDRSIGRGTYVKGQEPQATARNDKWMVLCDAARMEAPLVRQILAVNPSAQAVAEPLTLRPSFINQHDIVLDLDPRTPEAFRRSVLVRGMTLVRVGHEAGQVVTHAIVPDRAHAAWRLCRDMLLAGHRRIVVVSGGEDTVVADAARLAAGRYGTDVEVVVATIDQATPLLDPASTAVLCDGEAAAQAVQRLAEQHPDLAHASIAGVGLCDAPIWSGIYITPAELAQATIDLLQNLQPHRPCVLHLAGQFIDRGTLHAVRQPPMALSA